jgi:hypothetical protein
MLCESGHTVTVCLSYYSLSDVCTTNPATTNFVWTNYTHNRTYLIPIHTGTAMFHITYPMCLRSKPQCEIHVEVFWVVTPCCVAIGYRRFGGPCCLHLSHWSIKYFAHVSRAGFDSHLLEECSHYACSSFWSRIKRIPLSPDNFTFALTLRTRNYRLRFRQVFLPVRYDL